MKGRENMYFQQLTIKRITTIAFYITLALLTVIGIHYFTNFVITTDETELELLFNTYENIAKWIFFLICFAQPIFLPIPEAVTLVVGSAFLGGFQTFILSWISAVLGIMTMFFITKYVGEKFILKYINQKHLEKYRAYVNKNETFILLLLFIIPVLPDEIICIGSGLSGIRAHRFFLIAVISKFLTSFTFAYSLPLAKISGLSASQLLLIIGIIILTVYVLVQFLTKKLETKKEKKEIGI